MESTADLLKALNDATDCKSLLKKNLPEEIQENLKDKKTELGGTLGDCIKSGTVSHLQFDQTFMGTQKTKIKTKNVRWLHHEKV